MYDHPRGKSPSEPCAEDRIGFGRSLSYRITVPSAIEKARRDAYPYRKPVWEPVQF